MTDVVVIGEATRHVDATLEAGRVLLDPDALADAIGWKLRPEGLCLDDTCVPVRDRTALFAGEQLDLAAVADALGRPIVIDGEAGVAAIALASEQRRAVLDDLRAPSFTLPGLDGVVHQLDEWRDTKKLLLAFASW